jgi:hypothetical protein
MPLCSRVTPEPAQSLLKPWRHRHPRASPALSQCFQDELCPVCRPPPRGNSKLFAASQIESFAESEGRKVAMLGCRALAIHNEVGRDAESAQWLERYFFTIFTAVQESALDLTKVRSSGTLVHRFPKRSLESSLANGIPCFGARGLGPHLAASDDFSLIRRGMRNFSVSSIKPRPPLMATFLEPAPCWTTRGEGVVLSSGIAADPETCFPNPSAEAPSFTEDHQLPAVLQLIFSATLG